MYGLFTPIAALIAKRDEYLTQHSLRFDSSDTDFLTQSNQVTATDSDKWTLSVWVKSASDGGGSTFRTIISGGDNNAPLYLSTDDTLNFYEYNGSTVQMQFYTSETIKVSDGWKHVVMSVDYALNSNTFGDKVKVWIDGTPATINVTTNPGTGVWNLQGNYASAMNGTTHTQAGTYPYRRIGKKANSYPRAFDGQMAEFHFIDGTAYDASYFGETRGGVWLPKEVTDVTYGNNGFYLDFSQPSSTINAFNAVTYVGDASTSNPVTGVGFSPDFVWAKDRDFASSHALFDTVRGIKQRLRSDTTDQEVTQNGVMSFDADGFTVGDNNGVNRSNSGFVAWAWKAGGSSNTYNIDDVGYATASAAGLDGGSITPTGASVNTEAGFSIIKYTGNGSTASISHGLNSTPECIIVKNLDAASTSWSVWHDGYGDNNYQTLYLDDTYNLATLNRTRISAVSNQTFSLANHVEVTGNADEHIAYCWHSVEGYSKIGSYVGNGSSNGPVVTTGFRPAFVLIKNITTDGYSWQIVDNARNFANPIAYRLKPNTSDIEVSTSVEFLSDGFQLTNTSNSINKNNDTFIYMAFADTSPDFGVDTTTDGTGVTLLLDGSSTTNDASSANIASNLVADTNITATNTSSLSISAPYGAGPVNVLDFPSNQTTGISHTSSSIPELLDPTETQWTIEMWVRPESFATYDYLIAQASDGATGWSNGLEWILDWDTSNIYFVGYNGSGGNTSLLQASISTYGITVNNWHHIAVVRDGSDTMLFLNGQKAATITNQNIVRTTGNRNLFIGTDPTDTYSFDGQMADIRITRGVARYTDSFTPPTSALSADVSGITGSDDVVLLLDGESYTDQSSSPLTVVETGGDNAMSLNTTTYKFGSSSYYFGDDTATSENRLYVQDASLAMGTGDFTYECWIYPTHAGDDSIFETRSSGAVGISDGFTLTAITTTSLRVWSGGAARITSGTISNLLNNWHHVAVVRSSGTTTLFVNGASQGSTTYSMNCTNNDIIIGMGRYAGSTTIAGGIYGGYIDDIRITKGAALYPFHPPISALTNDDTWDKPKNNFSIEGNITPDDQLIDTPNLRFASFDRNNTNSGMLFSEANLGLQAPNDSTWYNTLATQPIGPSDKIYFEWSNNQSTYLGYMGLSDSLIASSATNHLGETGTSYGFFIVNATTLKASHNGTDTNISTSTTTGPRILMCAIDRPNGEIHFGFNGVWMDGTNSSTTPIYPFYTNVPTTGNYYAAGSAATYGSVIYNLVSNFGQDHTFGGAKSPLLTPYSDANGVGEFYYQPPSGFLALATEYK